MAMTKNLSTENSERHWAFVRRIAEQVSNWPAWKQAQFYTIIGRQDDDVTLNTTVSADPQQSDLQQDQRRQVA
jgi:hypothetical protein